VRIGTRDYTPEEKRRPHMVLGPELREQGFKKGEPKKNKRERGVAIQKGKVPRPIQKISSRGTLPGPSKRGERKKTGGKSELVGQEGESASAELV